jgi:uridylate kinase
MTATTSVPLPAAAAKYKRVLLKISGEALMGDMPFGQDLETVRRICREIQRVHEMNVQICLVVGGGNIFRGISGANAGMERASADYMGMLATIINALALQNTLESLGIDTRVLSAITMVSVCEPYIRRRAIRHLEQGRVVICAAGTGNPFFTTDTAAALRAVELGCDVLIKGTQVDGVYTDDPKKNPNATRYEQLSYTEVLAKNLKVMDASAIALSRDNHMPILVTSLHDEGSFAQAVAGKGRFTLIQE